MRLATSRHAGREGGRFLFTLIAITLLPVCIHAAEPLFPAPLHLTRRIEDPLTELVVVIDEYCEGDRMISIHGDRVVVADHRLQTLTEIYRDRGTYSITRFDEIAKGQPVTTRAQTVLIAKSVGAHEGATGRMLEEFELSSSNARLQLAVDRSVTLSRPAVEVLLGTSYPNLASPEQESLAAAAASSLPAEQVTTFRDDGRELIFRNVVTRIGSERAPPELCSIPPGAKRVESRYTATNRTAAELDRR